MAERRNVEFAVEGGATLRGWLFVPGAKGPAPAITMAHGYAVRRNLIQEIVTLLRDGILVTSTAARTFSLDEIGAAVTQAESTGRQGKVLLVLRNNRLC